MLAQTPDNSTTTRPPFLWMIHLQQLVKGPLDTLLVNTILSDLQTFFLLVLSSPRMDLRPGPIRLIQLAWFGQIRAHFATYPNRVSVIWRLLSLINIRIFRWFLFLSIRNVPLNKIKHYRPSTLWPFNSIWAVLISAPYICAVILSF